MKAKQIYNKLEKDFIKKGMTDDWSSYMGSLQDLLTENFKNRSMGLMFDFTEEIDKVYTAVFPSKIVMKKILDDDIENAMLFVHHAAIWDIRKAPEIFQQIDRDLLLQFKERNISIFNFHVPLDNFGEYSTTKTLADALGVNFEKIFAPYFGAMCGIFGKTEFKNVKDLEKHFSKVVGHKVKLYEYGDVDIKDSRVALVAGGGNEIDILKEVASEGVNTYITGITILNDYSKKSHDFAKENNLNILGGTHYSTEKFACKKMVEYFEEMGLVSEFIPEEPVLEDM
jgi:putative NIF3 family GTP cyclohydrolase 1 type 2